jgi:hypothetical protein
VQFIFGSDSTYEEIHAAKSNEAFVNWSRTSPSPQGSNLLNASLVKHVGAVELDGRGQEEKCPLASGCVTGPHWFHQEGFGGIALLDQTHEGDTNHKSWYTDNDSEYQSGEKGELFSGLH